MQRTLLTIGHSAHSLELFLERLQANEISLVCDVRSHPVSRFVPQYNKKNLETALRSHGIAYSFLGRELGARPKDPACYPLGKVSYEKIAETALFAEGLSRLRQEMETRRAMLMCAEKDPIACHRCILICRHLRSPDLAIQHILDSGALETREETETRLLKAVGLEYPNLFEGREELIERAYDLQGRAIAYTVSAVPEGAPRIRENTDESCETLYHRFHEEERGRVLYSTQKSRSQESS